MPTISCQLCLNSSAYFVDEPFSNAVLNVSLHQGRVDSVQALQDLPNHMRVRFIIEAATTFASFLANCDEARCFRAEALPSKFHEMKLNVRNYLLH